MLADPTCKPVPDQIKSATIAIDGAQPDITCANLNDINYFVCGVECKCDTNDCKATASDVVITMLTCRDGDNSKLYIYHL